MIASWAKLSTNLEWVYPNIAKAEGFNVSVALDFIDNHHWGPGWRHSCSTAPFQATAGRLGPLSHLQCAYGVLAVRAVYGSSKGVISTAEPGAIHGCSKEQETVCRNLGEKSVVVS